jgi:hypothetical protein
MKEQFKWTTGRKGRIKLVTLSLIISAALALIFLWLLPGSGKNNDESAVPTGSLLPYSERPMGARMSFPDFVTEELMDAYLFAAKRPDVLRYMPCYCGCGLNQGHKNNLDCYIKGVGPGGNIVFSDHATYCDICIEITNDARRLSSEGQSLTRIRTYVDRAHSEKGPGTPTPLPPSS